MKVEREKELRTKGGGNLGKRDTKKNNALQLNRHQHYTRETTSNKWK